MQEMDSNIAENIRLYRIKSGLTVKQLSRIILKQHDVLIKPATLRNYEKNLHKVSATTLHILANVLNTDISDFYNKNNHSVLLDSNNKINMLEAYSMIRDNASKDALLFIARTLAKANV